MMKELLIKSISIGYWFSTCILWMYDNPSLFASPAMQKGVCQFVFQVLSVLCVKSDPFCFFFFYIYFSPRPRKSFKLFEILEELKLVWKCLSLLLSDGSLYNKLHQQQTNNGNSLLFFFNFLP